MDLSEASIPETTTRKALPPPSVGGYCQCGILWSSMKTWCDKCKTFTSSAPSGEVN